MGEKDKTTKLLEDYNDVFSDIFNTLVFGEEIINEKKLKAGPTESIYKMDDNEPHDQRRDVLKRYYDTAFRISSFGIENQSKFDKMMPFRIMNYDSATYMGQIKGKGKPKVLPVVTIVLNFSARKWKNANSLYDVLNIPDELKKYVSNYEIRVYDIAFLDDNTINNFKSDFRLVAKFLKAKRLNKIDQFFAEEGAVELDHIYELLAMLSAITKDANYKNIAPALLEKVKKGGKVYMCEVATKLKEEGKEEGLKALIDTIKELSPGICFEEVYKLVIKNETYKDVTPERVKKYL